MLEKLNGESGNYMVAISPVAICHVGLQMHFVWKPENLIDARVCFPERGPKSDIQNNV